MFGWTEWVLTAAVVVVVVKWRTFPQVALQLRSAVKKFREGLRADPPPQIRDVDPYEDEKEK